MLYAIYLTLHCIHSQAVRDILNPSLFILIKELIAAGAEAARGAVGAEGLHSYTDTLTTRVYCMLHVYGIQYTRTGCARYTKPFTVLGYLAHKKQLLSLGPP
jgi:hypothetical protein